MAKALKKIHINQYAIRRNKKAAKAGSTEPMEDVITCKTYKANQLGNRVAILDADGNEVAVVIYSPNKPLQCGAHCWLETRLDVKVT